MAKVALLIGISEYEPGLNPLPGSVKDVDAMQRVLAHPEMGDFAEADITLLKNPQRQEMEDAIYRLFSDRKKDDLLLLYFSGHGIKDESGKLYLATRSTRKDSSSRLVKPSAVATAFLHESINESRSQRQVVILDCCFSGAIAQGMTVKDDGAVNLQEQLGGKGRAILTSSSTTEYSFGQGAETSIYTRYLIEGIEKGAADQDEDGWISVDELHEYASAKVRETAPAMTPKFYPTEEGYKIFLAKSPKDDPKLKYRKEAESRAGQGKFSIFARKILDRKRIEWGLSIEEATAIENEVLQPYREYERNLREYEQALIEAVGIEYPFNEDASKDLKDYQKSLGLQDEDVASIEQRVLAFTKAVELKTTLGREGRVILTSTSSIQYNFVEKDSNLLPYTRRLIEGIETGEADLDNDGWISVDELHEYAANKITEAFPAMTPKFFPIKEGFRILVAKSPKKTSKTKVTGKIALLIGVSKYEHGNDWNLPSHCGKDDVAALARVLQHSAKGDFEDVQTLIDPEPTQMQEAIEILFSEADRGNLLLLYFAGLGVKDSNGNFYFTTRITRKNSRGDLIKATAVSASFIHEAMQSSKARRQIIIIDSAFSGAFARGLSAE
ncbi:MAG: caspase family protein [Nostoc sp. ChiQUE02]|uniref:caspase family protein n=1 Tax=Nostoc sp. ChiQUE02 TaxID=3075377 RepID=UPI002AD21D32|nr:caspase family protein [Nostoc sp. ChiQUE02]MDZ8232121.1 caspase family protein [Nostoc sp. ChiQUE02]